jgi:hypothetical protein
MCLLIPYSIGYDTGPTSCLCNTGFSWSGLSCIRNCSLIVGATTNSDNGNCNC